MTETDRLAMDHLMQQFARTLCQAGKAHGWTLDALRDLARVLRPLARSIINRLSDSNCEILVVKDL